MTWSKHDDHMHAHVKYVQLGPFHPLAYALDSAAMEWSADHLTDGKIPKAQVARLFTFEDVRIGKTKITAALVASKLCEAVRWIDHGDHFEIHDFLKYHPSRAEVLRQRAAAAERMRRNRSGGSSSSGGSHEGSGDVRANNDGTDDEPRRNGGRSSSSPVPVPVPGSFSEPSGSGSVAASDSDVGRSSPREGGFPDAEAVLEAELQQLFADALLSDPVTEYAAFQRYYRENPPGEHANWVVLAEAWLRNTVTMGEAGDRRQRRGPQAIRSLLDSIGKPLDDPDAVRKAELGVQAERLRVAERGRR